MGAILEQYLSSFGQALSQLSAPPGGQPGAGRRGTGPVMPGPQPPQGAPSFPPGEGEGVAEAPASASFELPQLPGESPEQHQAQFDRSMEGQVGQTFETAAPTQLEAAPAPTFEQPELAQIDTEALPERKGPMSEADVKTPEDMFSAASPEQLEGGIKALEGVLEEKGSSLDEAYENMTGGPPDTRLTREEKGQLLMEFGLGILSQGGSTQAIGQSGLSTLQSARDMQEAKRTRPAEERKAQLEMDLTEAQIEAARRTDKEITTDKEGNMIIVDVESGKTISVTDAEGNPVAADPKSQQRYEREVARDMYRAVSCTGLEGDEMKQCETRALAYAAGGAGTAIAFPEIMSREATEAALRVLLDDDARFTRHLIPSSGERKTISDMSGAERAEVVRELAKVWGIRPDDEEDEGPSPPTGWNHPNVGMTQDEARNLEPGSRIKHPDGGWVANRNGSLVRLDQNGQVMEGE